MNTFLAVLLYSGIGFSIMHNWLLFAGLCISIFSIRHGAIMLIPLAIVLDGYYGNYYSLPYVSLLAVVWYIVIEQIRPRIFDLDMIRS
ncbi:hypothetical protein GW766_02240 [Candidatus Parcubacteria bacterium]|nr:hypothetical protein [Candidatus Parcubacteria bacterium]